MKPLEIAAKAAYEYQVRIVQDIIVGYPTWEDMSQENKEHWYGTVKAALTSVKLSDILAIKQTGG